MTDILTAIDLLNLDFGVQKVDLVVAETEIGWLSFEIGAWQVYFEAARADFEAQRVDLVPWSS